MEYAPDGQSYCSACLFYGLNKPCWKCRMYLPSSELQQYLGQWTCPYCIMDLKDAEKKSDEDRTSYTSERGSGDKETLTGLHENEFCDRCKRKLVIVYIFNNRKLCEICIDKEKKEFEEVTGGATPMVMKFKLKGNEGLLQLVMRKMELVISRIIQGRKRRAVELVKKSKKDSKEKDNSEKEKKGEKNQSKKHGNNEDSDEFSKYFKD